MSIDHIYIQHIYQIPMFSNYLHINIGIYTRNLTTVFLLSIKLINKNIIRELIYIKSTPLGIWVKEKKKEKRLLAFVRELTHTIVWGDCWAWFMFVYIFIRWTVAAYAVTEWFTTVRPCVWIKYLYLYALGSGVRKNEKERLNVTISVDYTTHTRFPRWEFTVFFFVSFPVRITENTLTN